jgi:glucose uptake protein
MDILIALIPAIAWGSIGLVSGKLGGDANQQTLGMTFGAFIFSLATFLIARPAIDSKTIVLGLLMGLLWTVGQNGQFHAMKHLGVSIGLPISTGGQLLLNTIAGAVIFHEWTKTRDVTLGILAIVLLIIGVYYTAKQDKNGNKADSGKTLDFPKGLRAVTYSTIGYAAYTIVNTAAGLDALAVVLPMSVGMIIGASFLAWNRKTVVDQYVFRNIITGLLWGLGNVCMLYAVSKLGLAIGFSLSQMGTIISTLGGIFLLGEKKAKREMVYVIGGCVLIIVGGLVLGYMKA